MRSLTLTSLATSIVLCSAQNLPPVLPARFLFTFGDSYTTTGYSASSPLVPNVLSPFGNPQYPGYTTDGGAGWVGVVVKSLSPSNTLSYNYAVSGATVNQTFIPGVTNEDFINQTAEFKQYIAPKPEYAQWTSNNSAAGIWFGINDNLFTFSHDGASETRATDLGYYENQLEILYTTGLRRFVLFTVPPIWRTPFIHSLGPSVEGKAEFATNAWNERIHTIAQRFESTHSESAVAVLDTIPIFNTILDNPHAYGAPNNTCYNTDGTSCLWWNFLHPGQKIQTAVAHGIYGKLKAMGFYN